MKNSLFLYFVLLTTISFYSQNLIVNSNGELDPATNGWTIVSGGWESVAEIPPFEGVFHFSAGIATGTSEMYQDIDISSLSVDIDAGSVTFIFSGFLATWNGIDQPRIIVEFRDGSNTVLSSYDTGLQTPTAWTKFSDTRTSIVNTRTVRIRLLSTKNQGNNNDGYFDFLQFYAVTNLAASNIFPLYGNVGIGTDAPDSKLAVNGNVHAKEVKVDLLNWPDYVFEDSYNLPTLKSVEAHINENGYLPNIPNASEVEENGIKLGEMNAKLLEKIEELTLYAIGQEYAIEILENSEETLEQRVKKLEVMVEKLTKIIGEYHRTKEH